MKPKNPPPPRMSKDFATRLATVRIMLRLNQVELARALGLSQQRYNNYENLGRMPPEHILAKLCKEHGVSLDYLIADVGEWRRPSAMQIQLDREDDLPLQQRVRLLGYLEAVAKAIEPRQAAVKPETPQPKPPQARSRAPKGTR